MNTAKLIHDTILFVKQTLADAEGGHEIVNFTEATRP